MTSRERIPPDQCDRQDAYRKKHPKPVPPRPWSLFNGRGLFTTSDISTAAGLHADWAAIQKDPEGDHREGVPGHLCFWQARPTFDVWDEANRRGVPYIAQAESQAELQVALNLYGRLPLSIPHAFIGDPHEWTADTRKVAVAQGWDLILEWYWNNQPGYTAPDADSYPLFRNVCFGTFPSETVPGRRVTVPDYRAVWKGSFSCWDTEGMDGIDRTGFNA